MTFPGQLGADFFRLENKGPVAAWPKTSAIQQASLGPPGGCAARACEARAGAAGAPESENEATDTRELLTVMSIFAQ